MKKAYNMLIIIGCLLIIGIIVLFVIKIQPTHKNQMYFVDNNYWIILNSNELSNQTGFIKIKEQDYRTHFNLIYEKQNWCFYSLSIENYPKSDEYTPQEVIVYLHSKSIFEYLLT